MIEADGPCRGDWGRGRQLSVLRETGEGQLEETNREGGGVVGHVEEGGGGVGEESPKVCTRKAHEEGTPEEHTGRENREGDLGGCSRGQRVH